ncbi:MAG: hypothetical protein IPH12_06070 [Saprospirales bacterium]|jgi:hypothetical protein|nr:hypothetical protein [Saprospirales bacterium]MBK8923161.1 hypothetical protein [Saprospirales bacterium]
MYRLILIAGFALALLQACDPPIRLIPSRVKTGLDSVEYTGVVEAATALDLRSARFLAKVKVGDLGATLDCRYPDIVAHATGRARPIGGNLLVITEHKQNTVKSNCHRIKGDIYHVPNLEGMETQIVWHPARPLLPGDLRGKPPAVAAGEWPPLYATISCWLAGDFYKSALIRTETLFYADSTFMPADLGKKSLALRRAQLHFDLAELHARRLKAALAAPGPDLPALSRQHRELTARHQGMLRQQAGALDAELSGANPDTVLERWENQVKTEMADLKSWFGETAVDLRRKK